MTFNKDELRKAAKELDNLHTALAGKIAELEGDKLDFYFDHKPVSNELRLLNDAFEKVLAAENAIQEVFAAFYAIEVHNEHVAAKVTCLI
jgi:hypothetical protein